jgi:phage shock protein E
VNFTRRLTVTLVAAAVSITACGGSDSSDPENESDTPTADEPASAPAVEEAAGLPELVSPAAAAALLENPPDDLVILDVRTDDEFQQGHIDGATMIDFYRPDFREALAELDPEVPYLVYCRSDNRSGQATALMSELGFTSIYDVDGGVLSWEASGLPLVTD